MTARRVIRAAALLAAVGMSSRAFALTRCEVLDDAQSWVNAQVPYCQGPYGSYCTSGCDACYYDPLRGGECWRPDCSGYVSATWWLSYAMNTSGLCSYADHISWSDLQPGDAVVSCSEHAILFASWTDASQSAFNAYEESSCGTPAHKSVHRRWSDSYWGNMESTFSALRRPGIQSCCSAGQVETLGCGNCGTQSRSCDAGGHWGGWSACEGQGPCGPGDQQSQDCCDCGSQVRTCTSSCQWTDWGQCSGPDPNGGNNECATGEPGPCASGRVRCVQGCRQCDRDYDPVAEVCDDVDNDCSGAVDDGHPSQMGSPAPEYAAELQDQSYPMSLPFGGTGEAWAAFVNRGTSKWKSGELWLTTQSALQQQSSPFYDRDTWASWDVAAVLNTDVLPGETAHFRWVLRMPDRGPAAATETFVLSVPPGGLIRCPAPDMAVTVRSHAAAPEAEETSAPAVDVTSPEQGEEAAGCACRWSGRSPSQAAWFFITGALLAAATRRRTRRRGQCARILSCSGGDPEAPPNA